MLELTLKLTRLSELPFTLKLAVNPGISLFINELHTTVKEIPPASGIRLLESTEANLELYSLVINFTQT